MLQMLPKHAVAWLRWAIPVVFLGGYGVIAALPDLQLAVPEMLCVTAVLSGLLAVIFYLGHTGLVSWSPVLILVMSAGFRLLFICHSPQLSDDIYRYLLDGTQLKSGRNPYAQSPDAAARKYPELAVLVAKVNHSHLVTIYPPGAQLVFAAGVGFGGITGLKLLLIALDLALIAFIMRLLAVLGRPSWHSVLYAWHPLAILEISSAGHIDGVGVLFLFIALYFLIPLSEARTAGLHPGEGVRVFAGGMALAMSILVKLFPVVFLPGCWLLTHGRRRTRMAAGFTSGVLLLILPFLPEIQYMLGTLGVYTGTWEFSGLLFRAIRSALDSGSVSRCILVSVFALLIGWRYHRNRHEIGKKAFPGETLPPVLQTFYLISFGFLLVTPTLHPWYAIYLVAFLPFCPGASGFILAWSVMLGYRVLILYASMNLWVEDDLTPVLIWAGPLSAFGVLRLCRYYRNR